MKKKVMWLLLLLPLAVLAGCKNSGRSTQPQVVGQTPDPEFELPHERYTLDNGLTIILHQDKSDPIVAMATVVHVGSSREKPGRTGFAHFFEHMSFNNSENVPMGANRKMIPELGGTRNGGTWNDGTIYYEVVPKDAFEKLMWIDSDRFGYMIKTVKEATLEREKQVVKNEKRQRVDNRAYGHTDHVIRKALYPAEHPYSWTVIGDLEDLQRATLDDVRAFYREYYVPANATLVIAGDIDVAETKRMVQAWFGEIEAGEPVADLEPMPVSLAEPQRLYHLDGFAKVPELRITFPTVEQYHADSYALEALGQILAVGKSAPLFTTIVEEAEQSSSVAAYQSSDELAGTFTIRVRANPGVDLDAVSGSIRTALERFEREGVREVELEKIKAKKEVSFYRGMAGVLDKALELGIYNEFAGDPSYMHEERRREQAVSIEDVLRVYERYIKDRPAIITSFVPKSQPDLMVEGSARAQVQEEAIVAGAEKEFVEDESDDFERTKTVHDRSEPPLGPQPQIASPQIWGTQRSNGMKVLGIEHHELPLVHFSLRIDGGQWLDPADRLGTAALVADMLDEGTAQKTPLELEDAIALLGASIGVSASSDAIHIRGQTLARNLEATMALVTEMLVQPRWDAQEFERLKIARLSEIEERAANPNLVARNAFHRQVYGERHVAGRPLGGIRESVEKIQLEDLEAWYAAKVSPAHATLHVVGATGQAEVEAAIAALDAAWKGQAVSFPALPELTQPTRPRLFFIDIPDAKQSVIYMGQASVKGDDPRFYRLTVANNRLGQGSSARLTQTLRIEKGYTYGAYSSFSRSPYAGVFRASTQVRSNVTRESLQIVRDLVGSYAETFHDEDLATTKNLIRKGDTRRFETLGQLLRVLQTMSRFDLPADYIDQQAEELARLRLEEVHELIRTHLPIERMTYVIAGDAKTQLESVGTLGLGEPVLLDREGARL